MSLRLKIEAKSKTLFWCKRSIEENTYSLAALNSHPQIRKPWRIDGNKIEVIIGLKKEDEEVKQNLLEKEKVRGVTVIKILNQREPFIPAAEEEYFEEVDHPVKKASLKRIEDMQRNSARDPSLVPIPQGVGKDEIADPDIQRNCPSLLYCTEKFKKVDTAVKLALKNQTPVDKKLKEKLLFFQKQKNDIQSAIENEMITFEKYMEFLEKSLNHDKILYQYFVDIQDQAKAKQVKFRIECTDKELNQDVEDDE